VPTVGASSVVVDSLGKSCVSGVTMTVAEPERLIAVSLFELSMTVRERVVPELV
jgi:hypothetical protein